MKLAISADGPNLEDKIAQRFGTSQYLLIIDTDSGDFEAMPNPGASGHRGAGLQAIVLVISQDVTTVLTGYCNPNAQRQLIANGIEVIDGLSSTVREAVDKYQKGKLYKDVRADNDLKKGGGKFDRATLAQAFKSSANQFANMLPILVGIMLLIGLFNAFISKDLLASIFSGNSVVDTLLGACLGSILAGNPINSYVIGGELLKHGISLFAVTAFIVTWVTVGMVQLPAEIAALGKKFAIIRNALCFILAIPIAMLMTIIMDIISR